MTQREYLEALKRAVSLTNYDDNEEYIGATYEELTAFIDGRITALDNKATANSAKNAQRKAETAQRAEKLYNALAEMDQPVTIGELKELTSDPDVKGWTPQRCSALIRSLGDKVVKQTIKGKSYFAIA